VFVGAVHLLTATGTWLEADHAEMILMSHRLVERGTFTLAPEGQRPPELYWSPAVRPRFLPGTAVALVPFVLLDRWLGWHQPPHLGALVHFAGPVFALVALALVADAVRRAGASDLAAALVVLLLGTSWPIWQIVRHGGAEPVVAFWIALFLWGSVAGSARARVAACLALPWSHPTGTLLAPTLALTQPIGPRPGARGGLNRDRLVHAGVALASAASVIALWQFAYHGDWWGGGYAHHARSPWFAHPPLQVWLRSYLPQCVLYAPIVTLLALLALAQGRRGLRLLLPGLAPLLVISVFFSLFTPTMGQDVIRRLAVVWLSLGLVAGLTWDGLGLGRAVAAGLVALNLAVGAYWFQLIESVYLPDGAYLPRLLWLRWVYEGRSPLAWGSYVGAALAALALALWKTAPLFSRKHDGARPA
jgi:hypothetical protein